MKILELFGGIGACSKALERIGVDYEIADYVEIDKYAVKSFNAIHGTNFEPQDVTKWDKDMQVDLIMHGSPCQDFSVAGKNAGGDKDSGTRSSLMYETLRIVEKLKPKYVIWENVKNLLGKKHKHNFDAYQEAMRGLGYRNYYQILNAKDYGVPQNRERVFTVSIRNDIEGDYVFPEKQPLRHKLKDILEDNVDERYYLSDEQVSKIKLSNFTQERTRIQEGDISQTLLSRDYKDPKCVRVGGLYDKEGSRHQADSIYDPNGVCATLSTMQGGNQEPIIIDDYNQRVRVDQDTMGTLTTNCGVGAPQGRLKKINEPKDYSPTLRAQTHGNEPCVLEPKEVSKTVRASGRGSLDKHSWDIVLEPQTALEQPVGRDYKKHGKVRETQYEVKNDGVSHALRINGETLAVEPIKIKTANIKGYDEASDGDAIDLQYPDSKTRRGRVGHGVSKTLMTSDQMAVVNGYRIRKLTPLECWRLMGFDDADYAKAAQVNSNTQLYKQAGNSIVVNVLEGVLKNLLKRDEAQNE